MKKNTLTWKTVYNNHNVIYNFFIAELKVNSVLEGNHIVKRLLPVGCPFIVYTF